MSALQATRKKAGLTQTQLAEKVGKTQAAIGHYETGRRVPSLTECRAIVAVLVEAGVDCDLDQVFPDPVIEPAQLAS